MSFRSGVGLRALPGVFGRLRWGRRSSTAGFVALVPPGVSRFRYTERGAEAPN